MARYILDTSAFVKSVIPEAGSDRVQELIDAAVAGFHETYVLDLAFDEATNAIWKREQRGELTSEEALEALGRLTQLGKPLRVLRSQKYLPRALEIAMSLSLTVYDAVCLACAEKDGLVLVTGDRPQRRAARALLPPIQVELL